MTSNTRHMLVRTTSNFTKGMNLKGRYEASPYSKGVCCANAQSWFRRTGATEKNTADVNGKILK